MYRDQLPPSHYLQPDPSASIWVKSQTNAWSRPIDAGRNFPICLKMSPRIKFNKYYNFYSLSHEQYFK